MNIYNQDKTKLVNSVFSNVHKNYDLMNDLMSLGVHRLWKRNLITWMNPQVGNKVIDVASGTGDSSKQVDFFSKIYEHQKTLNRSLNHNFYKLCQIQS